jgi:hypothetical protein
MHYIDHVLRTIRNIHYGTNFVFFIFLSKTFRRKFRQIFIDRISQATNRLFRRNPTTINIHNVNSFKANRQRDWNSKLEKKRKKRSGDHTRGLESLSRSIFDETPSLIADVRMHEEEEEIVPIIDLEHNNLSRYDGE